MNSNLQIICEFVFKRIVPPILKAQALTLGVGPPVGWSQCDRLLDGLTCYHLQWRPDAFSCFLPTLASLAQGVRK